ncbi:hypothetical protein A1O3_09365 [Capronia epimyces CBS 606.96]|uniref:Mucin n=1 Tax=Capronia epimyces CBS 606.96 TaxID=1182542 RepID=W9Y710_9EURO|nr:uncharacterized protein A1O3_09365 [Capronia epimyces CBS 606.96]EXJ78204.1 hypothetical protein A1O3_09365 [Capronia epimyces CBS 606.96]
MSYLTIPLYTSDKPSLLPSGVLQPGQLLNRNRLRRRRASTTNNQATPSTVAWFGSLPPAVQKRLFSKEECSFYTLAKNTIILDAADEILRRRSSRTNQLAAVEPRFSEALTAVELDNLKDEARVDSAIDMNDYSAEGFRWLEDEGDLDLELDDYHEAIAETARKTASISEPVKRPFRRNTSISSISIRRGRNSTSSSRGQGEIPSVPPLPLKSNDPSSPTSLKHFRSQASLSSIDPRATHYQDPAARLKLRLYLASPQKFDEAIEFGFPSVGQKTKQWDHTRPMTSPQPRPDVNRTFFHEDTPSLSGDDGDDVDEPDTLYDPRTPDDAVFHMHRQSKKTSVDGSTGSRLFSTRRHPETYTRGVTADREMTLHMTLTRPDLRSPEEIQLVNQKSINDLPLERPELASDGHGISIWDTLPPEESRVKRFLRKLRLK